MSHYSDFIEKAELSYRNYIASGHHQFTDPDEYGRYLASYTLFNDTAQLMRRATIIRLRGDQSAIFMETPVDYSQDFLKWLRLPYQDIYIQLEQPFRFSSYAPRTPEQIAQWEIDYNRAPPAEKERLIKVRDNPDPEIRGILLCQTDEPEKLDIENMVLDQEIEDFPVKQADRVIHVVFLMPMALYELNVHSFTICITKDNQIKTARRFSSKDTITKATQWCVGVINFLSSPSVKLVRNSPAPELQKARAKKGKPPLPGWYEITYRKHVHEYSRDKKSEKRWEHGYRYDVRGHFKTFKVGAMAGRVVWCPPHQRGIRHETYIPKGYRGEHL